MSDCGTGLISRYQARLALPTSVKPISLLEGSTPLVCLNSLCDPERGIVVYGKVGEVRALQKYRSAEYRMMNLQGFQLANGLPAGERPLARGAGDRRSVTAFRHGGWLLLKCIFLSVD